MEAANSNFERLAVLETFHKNHVFWLFNQEIVNVSFIDIECASLDVPNINDQEHLIGYLRGPFKISLENASHRVHDSLCRYLLYLMSVSSNMAVVEECYKILVERTRSTTPFSMLTSDVVTIFANYGTVQRKLWPVSNPDFVLECTLNGKPLLVDFYQPDQLMDHHFPRDNLKAILKLFQINIVNHCSFSDIHKYGIFHMMLNLVMSNNIINNISLTQIIRKILQSILLSFSEEEWNDLNNRKIEDLAEVSGHADLTEDYVGMVQRIECIPVDTERGMQVKRSAAHLAFQEMLQFDTVNLCGLITIDDVIFMINATIQVKNLNMVITYGLVKLIEMCLDIGTSDKEKLKKTMGLLKELGQSIPIVTLDSDYMMTCNHFYLKNLVTELETMFKNQVLQSEDEK